jgi:hypothetical protein
VRDFADDDAAANDDRDDEISDLKAQINELSLDADAADALRDELSAVRAEATLKRSECSRAAAAVAALEGLCATQTTAAVSLCFFFCFAHIAKYVCTSLYRNLWARAVLEGSCATQTTAAVSFVLCIVFASQLFFVLFVLFASQLYIV